jgi:micrococcal nuclease
MKIFTSPITNMGEEKKSETINQDSFVYRNFDCIPSSAEPEVGWVVDVIDGDSIRAEIAGEVVEIRYIGINTPEYYSTEREEAEKATLANISMVEGKKVYLFRDTTNVDKYQRLLRYVFSDTMFINYELVNRGFAKAKAYPPNTACQILFELAEK